MRPALATWLVALLLVALSVVTCVAWIDVPVAVWVHDTFGGRHFGERVASAPLLSIPLFSAVIFVLYGLLTLAGRRPSRIEIAIVLCDISLLITNTIKDQLKFIFGRTWPESWAPYVSSLVRDNEYGFHFFQSGQSFESFPSGHAAAVAAVMSVLWIEFPALRAGYVICTALAGVGLVLLNLHFVSDVIAGTFLGASVGLFLMTLLSYLTRTVAAEDPVSRVPRSPLAMAAYEKAGSDANYITEIPGRPPRVMPAGPPEGFAIERAGRPSNEINPAR